MGKHIEEDERGAVGAAASEVGERQTLEAHSGAYLVVPGGHYEQSDDEARDDKRSHQPSLEG